MNYGIYYPQTAEWFQNTKKQVLVMSLASAKHVRRVLSKGAQEPVQVKEYDGEDWILYDGPLLDFESNWS